VIGQRGPHALTIEEWRALELAHSDQKIEYIDGQVSFVSGGSLAHARIGSNTVRTLEDALGNSLCNVYNSDASVKLSETRYTYPDVSVSCDPLDQAETDHMRVQKPCVVVEVLSDSTEGKDRISKAHYYHECPSIQEYVLISTRYQGVEVQRRLGSEWTLHTFKPGDQVELTSINIHFPLDLLYRGTGVHIISDQQESN
jgi:Uma2 family endonuclease